jgi:O-antigen/teichoic acid export membrane protein
MNDKRRSWSFLDTSVEQSYVWSFALTLLPVVSAFVVSWIVARFAGPGVWGTVTWAMAFATTVLILAKLGLDLGASRLASEYGVNRPGALRGLFRTALGLRLVATLVCAAATLAAAPSIAGWFGKPELAGVVRMAAAIILCASVYEFHEHFLVGLNRHATVSRVRAATLTTRVAITAAIVSTGLGAVHVLAGYVAAWIVGISAFAILLHRFLPPADPGADGDTRSRLLRISLPLAVSSASVTIYSQMAKLMLGYFDTVEEVGQYAVALGVVEVALFPSFAFVMTLRPALASRWAKRELDACAGLLRDSLRLSLVSGVLFASIFAVWSVPLIRTVYGDAFSYAGRLMYVFSGVLVLRAVGALILPALVAAERTSVYAWLTTGSALVNFVLNLVLIPRMHASGAIYATLISYGLLVVVGMTQVFRHFNARVSVSDLSTIARTLLAGVLAAATCWLLRGWVAADTGLFPVVLAAFQAILFLVLVVLVRVVRGEEIRSAARRLITPRAS